ncbi:MAG: HD domain-containing protein [Cytophagaceae bacterium]|nr:HD domain-containing protein [Cytophagaceae bacterium]
MVSIGGETSELTANDFWEGVVDVERLNKLFLEYKSNKKMKKYIEERTFALDFAKKAFKGVLDKGGKPYIDHCKRVGLISYSDSLSEYAFYKELEEAEFLATEIGIAGMLHDVVEDTCISIETIELLFGKEVARLVDLVTRKDENTF